MGWGGGGLSGSSDVVPGPLDGTAEHHAEDHPKDLYGGRETALISSRTVLEQHFNQTCRTNSAIIRFPSLKMLKGAQDLTMMMPMPMPTPPMMCSLPSNTSLMADGQF